MKQDINILYNATDILTAVKTGVLLTTKADSIVNTMTISWGTLGIEWNKSIFTVFVRESRFTKQLLDANPEFTISMPHGPFDPKILGFCGSKSGRDVNKIKELGLTLEPAKTISVPAIKEFPLTLECKVIYKQKQNFDVIPAHHQALFYPLDDDNELDVHTAYYGEIVSAYMIKD